MAEFRFTNEHRSDELGNVIDVLRSPRLWIPTNEDYPDFDKWLLKTEAHVASGDMRAMLAYAGATPVGAIVYRKHRDHPRTVAIRNISVSPDSRGRYIGSFLLRNTELEAVRQDFPECNEVVVDTKATNGRMLSFLADHGYILDEVRDLYGLNAGLDAILVKSIS